MLRIARWLLFLALWLGSVFILWIYISISVIEMGPAYGGADPNFNYLSWSPDSSQLAFVGSGEYLRGGVYLVDADGDNLHLLIERDKKTTAPVWSPDGKYLAILVSWQEGEQSYREIYLYHRSTHELERITYNFDDEMGLVWLNEQYLGYQNNGYWKVNIDSKVIERISKVQYPDPLTQYSELAVHGNLKAEPICVEYYDNGAPDLYGMPRCHSYHLNISVNEKITSVIHEGHLEQAKLGYLLEMLLIKLLPIASFIIALGGIGRYMLVRRINSLFVIYWLFVLLALFLTWRTIPNTYPF